MTGRWEEEVREITTRKEYRVYAWGKDGNVEVATCNSPGQARDMVKRAAAQGIEAEMFVYEWRNNKFWPQMSAEPKLTKEETMRNLRRLKNLLGGISDAPPEEAELSDELQPEADATTAD